MNSWIISSRTRLNVRTAVSCCSFEIYLTSAYVNKQARFTSLLRQTSHYFVRICIIKMWANETDIRNRRTTTVMTQGNYVLGANMCKVKWINKFNLQERERERERERKRRAFKQRTKACEWNVSSFVLLTAATTSSVEWKTRTRAHKQPQDSFIHLFILLYSTHSKHVCVRVCFGCIQTQAKLELLCKNLDIHNVYVIWASTSTSTSTWTIICWHNAQQQQQQQQNEQTCCKKRSSKYVYAF